MARVPKCPPDLVDLPGFGQGLSDPSPAEGLALVKAFLRVSDLSLRQAIIQLVEKIADRVDKQ
jgi:hypothetical protein